MVENPVHLPIHGKRCEMAELKSGENKGRPFYRGETTDQEQAIEWFERVKTEKAGCRIIFTGNQFDHHYLGRYTDGTSKDVIYGDVRIEQYSTTGEMIDALGEEAVYKMAYAQYIIDQDQSCTRAPSQGGAAKKVQVKLDSFLEAAYTMFKTGRMSETDFRNLAREDAYKFFPPNRK
jgi:hypothetical protein